MLHFYLVRIYLLFASRPITIIWLFDIDLDHGQRPSKTDCNIIHQMTPR